MEQHKAERKAMKKKKAPPQAESPRFDLIDPWALLCVARVASTDAAARGEWAHLKSGATMATYERQLCERLNAYHRGEWESAEGGENLAHVIYNAACLLGIRRKIEGGK